MIFNISQLRSLKYVRMLFSHTRGEIHKNRAEPSHNEDVHTAACCFGFLRRRVEYLLLSSPFPNPAGQNGKKPKQCKGKERTINIYNLCSCVPQQYEIQSGFYYVHGLAVHKNILLNLIFCLKLTTRLHVIFVEATAKFGMNMSCESFTLAKWLDL